MWAVPRLCGFYPGICLTIEEKARKNLSHLWPFCLHHVFAHCLHKETNFGENFTEHNMCVLIASASFVCSISRFKENSEKYCHNIHIYICKLSVILARLCLNFNFLDRFSKISQESNLMKILPVGLHLFHADGQTDRDMVVFIIAFCDFAKAPKAAVSSSENLSAGPLANFLK
jgi:hypothetical protein